VSRTEQLFYVFECTTEGCTAEFYLNDIPIIRRGPAFGPFYAGQANQYICDGINEITIVISPGSRPGRALTGDSSERTRTTFKDARASARMARYPFGAVVGGPDAKDLLRVAWESGSGDSSRYAPLVTGGSADLGNIFGAWAWQSAPAAILDDQSRREIREFLTSLAASLAAGDAAPFVAAGAARLADTERAYGLQPGERAEMIRRITKEDAAQPWWGIQPLDEAQFDLRVCGRGRLVECIAADWLPILREKPDPEGGFGTYSMLLAKTGGAWQIVL
jgi:hypothetical protein